MFQSFKLRAILNIFTFNTSVEILKFKINETKERGYQARLAKIALCHATHLSHILRNEGALSPDQALALSIFWGFKENETDFFLALLASERAKTSALKSKMANEIQKMRDAAAKV